MTCDVFSPLVLVLCGPENVRASVACATGELTVTWNISVPSDNYTTTISRGIGQPLLCNSTETQCTIGGLLCGSSYTVIVLSVTRTCFSLPSTEVTVQTCEKRRFIIIKDVTTAVVLFWMQSQTSPSSLFPFSAMSSHHHQSCAHMCSWSCSCVMGGQCQCQILHCCRCERQRSQVKLHNQSNFLQPLWTPVWRGLHHWCFRSWWQLYRSTEWHYQFEHR